VKTIEIQDAVLDASVREAQQERIVLTRNGRPVALLLGVESLDLDLEQLALAQSDRFWKLITERRKQPTLTRTELEQQLAQQ
jgi:hypothetical protein